MDPLWKLELQIQGSAFVPTLTRTDKNYRGLEGGDGTQSTR